MGLPYIFYNYIVNAIAALSTGILEPILEPIGAQLVSTGGTVDITPALVNATTVTYTSSGLPAGLTINSSNGRITGTLSSVGAWRPTITATNESGSDTAWIPINVYSTSLNVTQASGFPFYSTANNQRLILTENIVATGTAIAVKNTGVCVDLNGFSITYNNAPIVYIPNHSFEIGSGTGNFASGWNFTNTYNTIRHSGIYLNNEVYDGQYSLRFNTTGNQYVESESTITIEPNTTYSLSAMFELGGSGDYVNPGVTGYVRLIGNSGETTRQVSYSNTNYRGIALTETTFKTSSVQENYTIRIGVSGHTSSTKPFYIDDIKLQRTKVHGVVVSPKSWNTGQTPDVLQYGAGTNAIITNGTIIQGNDAGTFSHGVFIYNEQGAVIDNVNVAVTGSNTSALLGQTNTTYESIVNQCNLTSNVRTISSRDAFDGGVTKGLLGIFSHNTINNGPHAGIYAGGVSGSISCNIFGNIIRLKSKYTNAFAIIPSFGSQVYRNQILNGSGEYTSHGIGLVGGTASVPSRFYDNVVQVQQISGINQEYQGIPIGGVFGMQLDNSPGTGAEGILYIEVYDNEITVYGVTNGYCFRLTVPGDAVLSFFRNILRAIASEGGHACPVSIYGETASEPGTWIAENVMFNDNTFITNDGICIDSTRVPNAIFNRTTFQSTTPISSPQPLTTAYHSGTAPHVYIHFVDTIFADAASRSYLEDATVLFYGPGYTQTDNRMTVYEEWTTTIQVNNSGGPMVTGVVIRDTNANIVLTQDTNVSGWVTTGLKQQQVSGITKTTYNDYTAVAAFTTGTFTANVPQTVNIQVL